jgi:hypothetical protein
MHVFPLKGLAKRSAGHRSQMVAGPFLERSMFEECGGIAC